MRGAFTLGKKWAGCLAAQHEVAATASKCSFRSALSTGLEEVVASPASIGESAGRKAGSKARADSVHPVLLALHGRQDLYHANSGHRAQFQN